MATPKKKHLIELLIEADIKWPDGAEYAAQDRRDLYVWFYSTKPKRTNYDYWSGGVSGSIIDNYQLYSLCHNWHQTIVTREQYAEALAANIGEPVDISAQSNQVCESEDIPASKPAPEYCASVMRQMPDNTIEQLTADYHAKATEADRLRAVAYEARKAANDALLELKKAGELIGLVISINTQSK